MMPAINPGQKILVTLYDKDTAGDRDSLAVGDIIVYQSPFYDIDGQGRYMIRRITGVNGRWIEVSCDAPVTQGGEPVIIEKEQVLGKVITTWERESAS